MTVISRRTSAEAVYTVLPQISEINLIREHKQGNFLFNHFPNGQGAKRASCSTIYCVQIKKKFYLDKLVFVLFLCNPDILFLCITLSVSNLGTMLFCSLNERCFWYLAVSHKAKEKKAYVCCVHENNRNI